MKIRLPLAIGSIVFGFICASNSSRAAITLVDHGKSDYRIVIPASAIASEKYAADEFQRYLAKMTGVTLPIVNDEEKETRHEILLGATKRKASRRTALSALGPDGYVLRTDGSRLVIDGGQPRGTLYGVYDILEEKLGVRWFTADLEVVPHTNRVVLPNLRESIRPALEYREVFWTETMRDADFAARHRLNGDHYHLEDKHGGRFAVYQPFVHSMDSLVPPELFQQHPEYFPLINGQRKSGYVQRCLSNPEVLKLAITTVRKWLKEHPEATIISVSQNDTGNWCQCPRCKALDDAEGTPAASLLNFVNAVAADLEPDYPHVQIDTLAYQYTRKPPKTIRPRRNVIIRLCSIECCFAHPLASCTSGQDASFRGDIQAWEPVAQKLYVWDYTPNFANYQQPFPNFAALQPNVQFFVQHGVKGIFEQGNYSGGGFGEMGPLRAYLLARLLWNPQTDLKQDTDEFCAAYYGRAAGGIRSYLSLLEAQVLSPNVHAHIYDSPTAAYLNTEFLNAAQKLFDSAEVAAENDEVRFRVQIARLPVWYVILATNRVTGPERQALLEKFLQIARKAGISNISEGQSLANWAKSQGM